MFFMVAICGCSTSTDTGSDAATSSDAGSSDVTGCFVVNPSTQTCSYGSTACGTASCGGDASLGTCPSADLYGCCLTMGSCGLATAAICYYDAEAGLPAAQSCQYEGYSGSHVVWQTAPP